MKIKFIKLTRESREYYMPVGSFYITRYKIDDGKIHQWIIPLHGEAEAEGFMVDQTLEEIMRQINEL